MKFGARQRKRWHRAAMHDLNIQVRCSLDIGDGPAALEPNGKVLMMASPTIFNPPSTFCEWDGENLTEIPGSQYID